MVTEAIAEQPERDWDEVAKAYEGVDLGECRRLAASYLRELLEDPQIKKPLDDIRNGLNEKYKDFKFPHEAADIRPGMKLPYHQIEHSGNDVPLDALYMAIVHAKSIGEEIDVKDLKPLVMMAVYHDTGFLDQYKDNEGKGAMRMKEDLEKLGYPEESIPFYTDGVLSTKVNYSSGGFRQTITEESHYFYKILCDADVSNFGKANHEEMSELFRRENSTMNNLPYPEEGSKEMLEADERRLGMLKAHRWNSEVAFFLYEKQKRENIRFLEEKILKQRASLQQKPQPELVHTLQ